MERLYYLIDVQDGLEPFVRGPFKTEKQRDNRARRIRSIQGEEDRLFWADVDESGKLIVGSYMAGFFFQGSTDHID